MYSVVGDLPSTLRSVLVPVGINVERHEPKNAKNKSKRSFLENPKHDREKRKERSFLRMGSQHGVDRQGTLLPGPHLLGRSFDRRSFVDTLLLALVVVVVDLKHSLEARRDPETERDIRQQRQPPPAAPLPMPLLSLGRFAKSGINSKPCLVVFCLCFARLLLRCFPAGEQSSTSAQFGS